MAAQVDTPPKPADPKKAAPSAEDEARLAARHQALFAYVLSRTFILITLLTALGLVGYAAAIKLPALLDLLVAKYLA
ncbi:hypothetical protein KDL45_04885 [bacterium]|nr:hypothetical protein [bacterium]